MNIIPGTLELEFWDEVARKLETGNHFDPQRAWTGIRGFRSALRDHNAEDAVYHRNPEDVAEAISKGEFLTGIE